MKYLLDTHVFLWLIRGENLSEAARKTFLDRNNQIYTILTIDEKIQQYAVPTRW